MYIVRNTLDPSLIKLACLPDRDISNQEKEDGMPEDLVNGSILSWQTADQIASYGILFVILSLILVHGKTIPDSTYSLYTCFKLYNQSNSAQIFSGPSLNASDWQRQPKSK